MLGKEILIEADMSSQISIDFRLLALPKPKVIEEPIRDGDVVIGNDPLEVPRQMKHGLKVLLAIEELNRNVPLNDLIYPAAEAGYYKIRQKIEDHYSIDLRHSSIKHTIEELLRIGFIKFNRPPEFGRSAKYQTLTPEGKLAMLRGVNATHFRISQNQVQLIAPPCGRLYVV
jgi:hypothetical protein